MAVFSPSIGGVSFLTIRGRVTPIGKKLQTLERSGVNGQGYIQIGKRGPVAELMTTADVANSAGVVSHVSACVALAGSLVTVVLDDGTTSYNVAVLQAPELVESYFVSTPVGGLVAGSFVCVLRWSVQATQ